MSQPPPTSPPPLTVPVQEAGWVFRLEMMFSNLALGYFRYILVAVGIGLVGVLIYGVSTSYQVGAQRTAAQALAEVRVELRASLYAGLDPAVQAAAKRAGYGLGETFNEIGQLPRDEQQAVMASAPEIMAVQDLLGALPPEAREELFAAEDDLTSAFLFVGIPNDAEKKLITDSAAKLVAVADEHGGVAAGIAYLDAADWCSRAGDAAGRRAALEKALATGLGDPVRAAAVISLAGIELDAGQADAAIARLRALSTSATGFFQEQATYELALTLELAGKTDDAKAAWGAFATQFPASAHADDARRREKRLGGGALPTDAVPPVDGAPPADDAPLVAPAEGTQPPVGP